MTQRLPIPGSDNGSWGDILNGFLEVSHASDGTLASSVVGTNQLQNNAVTNAQLDSTTQSKLVAAASAVQTVNGKSPTSGAVTLVATDVGAITQSQADARYPQSGGYVASTAVGAALAVFDPDDATYGAVRDAIEGGGASITSGSNVLTWAVGFTSSNILSPNGQHKWVCVQGAGTGGVVLFAQITGYMASNQVTLASNAATTVSGVLAAYGTDSTSALDACAVAQNAVYVNATGRAVISLKPGGYFYQGTGFALKAPRIKAVGRQATTFYMPPTTSLIVTPLTSGALGQISEMDVRVRTFGGYGLIHHTYTGANSGLNDFIVDMECFYPAGCAVSTCTSDNPYWKITGRVVGANRSGFGVALAGYTDACEIDVDFYGLQVGVKLGRGSDTCIVRGTWTGSGSYVSTPCIPIWIVPNSSIINSGRGTWINGFRFGNESYNAADYQILFADETVTGDFSNNQPNLTSASTGYVTGVMFTGCLFTGAGSSPRGPVVFSTTPNVGGCHFSGVIDATLPSYILQFLNAPTTANGRQGLNVIGPFFSDGQSVRGYQSCQATNGSNVAVIVDPDGLFSRFGNTPLAYMGGGRRTGLVSLVGTTPSSAVGSASVAAITDAVGGSDAYAYTFVNLTDSVYVSISSGSMPTGQTIWIEFDAQTGASSPTNDIQAILQYSAGGQNSFDQAVVPTSSWAPFRFVIPEGVRDNTGTWQFIFKPNSNVGSINIGRVRVYAAREPINIDAPGTPNIQIFNSSGTWTRPATTLTRIDVIAQGGGGGSGRQGASGTIRCGGGGGGGGGYTSAMYPTSALGATVAVTYANTGGAGGSTQATADTNGNAGTAGSNAEFGSNLAFATGGQGGAGGTATTGTGGSAGGGQFSGGSGGTASTSGGTGGTGGNGNNAGSGGGAGGGIPVGNTFSAGGGGGLVGMTDVSGGTAGSTDGANGTAGTAGTVGTYIPGSGGGGGASSILTIGGSGGTGASHGGGGGGGGASLDGNSSGAGMAGGGGIVIVTSW